ncbi:MAG: hypothetical protein ACOZHQ_13370 [Thermodesulfobacteriota bacterium]
MSSQPPRPLPPLIILLAVLLSLLAGWAASPAPAGAASGLVGAGDQRYLAFFPPPQARGELKISLHPAKPAVGRPVVIGFGLPFPPGFSDDPGRIALFDNLGHEIPIHVKVLARWPQAMPGGGSLRAVLIQFQDLIAAEMQRDYLVRWGQPRGQSEKRGWSSRQDWILVDDGSYPPGAVMEPPVYVTLPPAWLGMCLLKGRINPAGTAPGFAWYDQEMRNYFGTAVNHYEYPVQEKLQIDYVHQSEPWLFDRATTLFMVYLRQGGLEPLRQAHRAAQYYARQIRSDGGFALLGNGPNSRDVKFGYQECLALDHWLTGDELMLDVSRRVLALLDAWDHHYGLDKGFWTERHMAFSLLNATVAYEILGDPALLTQARERFDSVHQFQTQPPAGAPAGLGCTPHKGKQHGENLEGWYCSPWMTALLVDAIMRYYLVSADPRAPESVTEFARFVAQRGLYTINHESYKQPYQVPMYLTNLHDPAKHMIDRWTDQQHALDMSAVMAAALRLAPPDHRHRQLLERALNELLLTAQFDFEKNVNPYGHRDNRPKYPLNPPRRFNWWFRTTAGLDWLIEPR